MRIKIPAVGLLALLACAGCVQLPEQDPVEDDEVYCQVDQATGSHLDIRQTCTDGSDNNARDARGPLRELQRGTVEPRDRGGN